MVEDDPLPYVELLLPEEPLAPDVVSLGELVVELGELVLDELESVLGEVAPLAPLLEPDLLKYASHSAREIMPSLFVSTAEKSGVVVLLEEPPAEEVDGVVEDDGLVVELDEESLEVDGDEVDGLVVDDEDCATAAVDSAKSTAAVRVLRFLMSEASDGLGNCACSCASAVPLPRFRRPRCGKKSPALGGAR